VVAVLNEFYELQLTQEERCKLALLATIEISPRASGGDLAASTLGGWVRYVSPDGAALRRYRASHGVQAALASEDAWSGLRVTPRPSPDKRQPRVGWTGSPASTDQLVAEVRGPERTVTADAPGETFVSSSRARVTELVAGIMN